MKQTPSSSPEPREIKPEFDPFLALPTREKWELLKSTLFAAEDLHEIKEQPHGVDLLLQNLVEIVGQNLGNIITPDAPEKEKSQLSFHLPYGKEYFAILYPPIRMPYRWTEYALHLMPRSSLMRAGILAQESDFYGTKDQNQMNELGERFDYYEDGRQGAIKIKVLNPNGVTIEQGAPLIQMIAEPLPSGQSDIEKITREQTRFLSERESEKKESLCLGEVREFLSLTPHIASNQKENKLEVTAPLKKIEGRYSLRKGVPYLFRTKETITLTNHEIAFTHGTKENENLLISGDSLIDAGYHGGLTYLAISQKDMIIDEGEVISYLFKINVPTTQKPYHGQWK